MVVHLKISRLQRSVLKAETCIAFLQTTLMMVRNCRSYILILLDGFVSFLPWTVLLIIIKQQKQHRINMVLDEYYQQP